MPYLPDVGASAMITSDSQQQIDSLVKQVNEWARIISNENRTDVYKDNAGTNRILIGVLPDGTTGIAISKSGIDILTAFS